MPSLSHLTYCKHTKSNLYLANFLATAVSEPIYTGSYIPCIKCHILLHRLGCTKEPVKARGTCISFVTRPVFIGEELLALRPTPKLEDRLLLAVRDCLFNILTATLHIRGCSSIHNLRMHHAVVTGNHLPWNEIHTNQIRK
jgi:hypothetical protein